MPEDLWAAVATLPDYTVVVDKHEGKAATISIPVEFESNVPTFVKIDSEFAIVGKLLKYGSLESFTVGEARGNAASGLTFGAEVEVAGVAGLSSSGWYSQYNIIVELLIRSFRCRPVELATTPLFVC